jgi:hypothetical protein
MKFIFIILLLTSFLNIYSQIEIPESGKELERLIDEKDTIALIKHHQKFDVDFSSEWRLKETEKRVDIDHYKFGYNFEWIKRKSDTIIYRTYTFDLYGNFYYGSEKRELNGKLISRGGIKIENRRLKYISQFFPDRAENILAIGKYEFEIYDKGKLVSIYRTRDLNHFYMLTEEKNKEKVELIYGIDYLNVKK